MSSYIKVAGFMYMWICTSVITAAMVYGGICGFVGIEPFK